MALQFKEYISAECNVFCRVRDPWGDFSNLHFGYPLQLGDLKIVSSETLYQALRFSDHPEIQKKVLETTKPMASKIVAYLPEHLPHTIEGWTEGLNVQAMRSSIRLKTFLHSARMLALFAQSAERPIVELSTRDDFWGAKPQPNGLLVGRNGLGRLWGETRHMARFSPKETWLMGQLPSDRLQLLGRPLSEWMDDVTKLAFETPPEQGLILL